MNATRIAICIDSSLREGVDSSVSRSLFRSRSEIFHPAVFEQNGQLDDAALPRECAQLDQTAEQAFADMGLSHDLSEWPLY